MRSILVGLVAAISLSCSSNQNTAVSNEQTANVNSKFSTTNTVNVTAPAIPESQLANSGTSVPGARTFIDGSQIVGKDIQPGTYRTRAGTPNCAWTRHAGVRNDQSEILVSSKPQGPAIVTIKSTDKGFESMGCGLWTSDLSRITSSPTVPFGDGEYLVGTDIAPGTWKAQTPADCYWARVKDFTGDPADIIANSTGSGIVTISKTDRGFITSGCGSWTKAD